MKPSIIIFVLLATVTGSAWSRWNYPRVRRDRYSYTRFDVKIPDPYHWLEDSKSPDTLSFVKRQNNVTHGYIRNHPQYESIRSNFQKLYNYTSYSAPAKHGDKYYISIRESHQNQAIIYSLDSLDDPKPKIFIDPNTFSNDGTVALSFVTFSHDGKWCAYGTSVGGSDWLTIRVKHVATLKDLDDKLNKIKFTSAGWNKNNKGFFYSYYDTYNGTGEGTETEVPKYQKLYYHRLNTSQEEDIKIHGFPDHPMWLVGTPTISEDGRSIHLFPTQGTSNTPWLFSRFDPEFTNASAFNFQWIVNEADAEYHYVGSNDQCTYIRTNYLAKNFRLVCVDLNRPERSNWKDVLSRTVVCTNKCTQYVLTDAFVINRDYLVATYMVDVQNVIQLYNLTTGKFLADVDTPIGTISATGGEMDEQEFFFRFTSFLSPGTIFHYDFRAGEHGRASIYKESTIADLDTEEYHTEQIFFQSKDGTKVPMFLVSRKDIIKDHKNPTWLNAYGGFNINIQPAYNPMAMFFVKNLNGVYAVANIRGGGEYGDNWHKAGMRLNKQNVFDDFASAGEWLIGSGYTSREYLTINGRSNGGLLVGVSSNQRPDIFGSAIAEVGVMDMLKFPLFTIGYAWVEEYGDPVNNRTEFEYIRQYSPLHNIKKSLRQYPNMLVLTADHDDRVVPAHSYKFISELQNRLGCRLKDTPMMIRIDANSGHGAGKPVSKWIEQYTDTICFLLKSTPYQYRP